MLATRRGCALSCVCVYARPRVSIMSSTRLCCVSERVCAEGASPPGIFYYYNLNRGMLAHMGQSVHICTHTPPGSLPITRCRDTQCVQRRTLSSVPVRKKRREYGAYALGVSFNGHRVSGTKLSIKGFWFLVHAFFALVTYFYPLFGPDRVRGSKHIWHS